MIELNEETIEDLKERLWKLYKFLDFKNRRFCKKMLKKEIMENFFGKFDEQ